MRFQYIYMFALYIYIYNTNLCTDHDEEINPWEWEERKENNVYSSLHIVALPFSCIIDYFRDLPSVNGLDTTRLLRLKWKVEKGDLIPSLRPNAENHKAIGQPYDLQTNWDLVTDCSVLKPFWWPDILHAKHTTVPERTVSPILCTSHSARGWFGIKF